MDEYKFKKESTGKWYIELPDYPGPKEDLQMVEGADTMLDIMAQENDTVSLILSDKYFEGGHYLEFIREATELENGAYYKLPYYNSIYYNLEIWLCDVTKYVFGKFPEQIFLINLNKND